MRKIKHINDQSGIALVLAMVMLVTLTILGIAALTSSRMGVLIASNEKFAAGAMQAADAGIEKGFLDLINDFKLDPTGRWSNSAFKTISTGSQVTLSNNTAYYTFPADGSDPPETAWGDPFNGNFGSSWDLYGAQTLGDSSYRVLLLRDAAKPDEVIIRSYAEIAEGGVQRSRKILQLRVKADYVDSWRNAIFAGGSGASVIRGNYRVAGPMHILGTGDNEIVWAMSGSAQVVNGYDFVGGISVADAADLKSRIPTIETTTVNGQTVETLETILRVKKGIVTLDGSANIGQQGTSGIATDDANAKYKSYLDAIKTNQAIEGSTSSNTYASEINMNGGYDLGDKIQMPNFSDQYTDSDGAVWDTYEQYINTNSLAVGAGKCSLIPYKNATDAGTAGFCVGCDGGGNCPSNPATGCIKWTNPTTGSPQLIVTGRVKLDNGCASNTVGRSGYTIEYKGQGVIYSEKSMTATGKLYASKTRLDGSAGAKFATDNLLGVMTKVNLTIDSSSYIMGAFFASGQILTGNNSNVIGTIASNNFDIGSGGGGSSGAFYVKQLSPEVKKMGMITSKTVYTFKKYEWKEVF